MRGVGEEYALEVRRDRLCGVDIVVSWLLKVDTAYGFIVLVIILNKIR